MSQKKIIVLPLNRVEGDLEVKIEIENGIITQASCAGIMYRGFENILVGRAALDGLVITPRICGICTTAHLYAAAKALDMLYNVQPPDNAIKIRNSTLMVEHIQSDMRHAFLLFMADFTNPAYKDHPLFEEALQRYEPLKGETVIQTIQQTQKIIEMIAIWGGQWPHSSFMVPGGVVSLPGAYEISQSLFLIQNFRKWYEERVLGCGLERWLEIKNKSDLFDWLEADDSHRTSDLGFYIRFSTKAGLDKLGRGYGNFISFGLLDMPQQTNLCPADGPGHFFSPGFAIGPSIQPFKQEKISEDVSHAWFDNSGSGLHPFDGKTKPYASGAEGKKYSWAKAPRYAGQPAETGPLAEMIMASNSLFTDLIKTDGASVFVRELARLTRPAHLIPLLETWLGETAENEDVFFTDYEKIDSGQGFGLIEAARGSLGHWIKIKDAKIEHYQIITPTAWNASPRDSQGNRGPLEEALIGTVIKDVDNPIEMDHVIRSHDPCLVCTVHVLDMKNANTRNKKVIIR